MEKLWLHGMRILAIRRRGSVRCRFSIAPARQPSRQASECRQQAGEEGVTRRAATTGIAGVPTDAALPLHQSASVLSRLLKENPPVSASTALSLLPEDEVRK